MRPRVLSFLYDQDWAIQLEEAGLDVDYIPYRGRHIWDHKTHEMPAGMNWTMNPLMYRYKAAVICDNEDVKRDPICAEAVEKFVGLEKMAGLTVFRISHKQRRSLGGLLHSVQSASPPRSSVVRTKQFWPIATHPGFMRHCHFILQMLMGEDEKEPEGTYTELGCGDGAILKFLANRFGLLDCNGFCEEESEEEVGHRVDPTLPISFTHNIVDAARECDYIVAPDCSGPLLFLLKKTIEEKARKIGVITLKKDEEDAPDIFGITDNFDGWSVYETPSHYVLRRKNGRD